MTPPWMRASLATALAGAALAASGCDLLATFLAQRPEEALVERLRDTWATPGQPFMEGRMGRDTVGEVTLRGGWRWDVTVPDAGDTWVLEVASVEMLEVFPGPEFGPWLVDTGRSLGMTAFLPREQLAAIATGEIGAVAAVQARFGRPDRQARTAVERVAYRRATGEGRSEWRLEPDSRSSRLLRDALTRVYDDLIDRDERVHACLGSLDPGRIPRSTQLACVAEVLERQFEEGGEP